MRSQAEIISLLTNPGIVAVVRTEKTEQVLPVCEALLAGGVIAVEITMTVPNALEAIRLASQQYGTRALIGVGTVLNAAAARAAIDAGAQYVVSPITRLELIDAAHAAGKPVMIGAYTPTEAEAQAKSPSAGKYGAVLNRGTYFAHCKVPSGTKLSICAAIQGGSAVGVTVETSPYQPELAECVAKSVLELKFLSRARLDVTRTTF